MLSRQEEMEERKSVLENEKRLRNQGTTFSQFAEADASTSLGRFNAISSPVVVGSSPIPKYPAAYLNHDPVPDEPPLGVDINEMPTCGEPHELKASVPLEPSVTPSLAQEPPGPSTFPEQEATPDPVPHAPPPTPPETGKRAAGSGFSSRKTFRRF